MLFDRMMVLLDKYLEYLTVAIVAATLMWPVYVRPQPNDPTVAVVVDIRADPSMASWMAEAIEQNIIREILAYQHIRTVDKHQVLGSSDQSIQSQDLLDIYGEAGIDVVFQGRLSSNRLQYEIFECWTPSRVEKSSFGLENDMGIILLKQRILSAASVFLKRGGLLEDKLFIAQRRMQSVQESNHVVGETQGHLKIAYLGYVAYAYAVFLSIPILLLYFGLGRKRFPKQLRIGFLRWMVPLVVASFGFGIHCSSDWLRHLWTGLDAHGDAQSFLMMLGNKLITWKWLVAILGGMAWAWFVMVTLRTAFPPIGGLDRVGHRQLLSLLRAWCAVCIQRIALLLFYYSPFVLLIWWIVAFFPTHQRPILIVVAPLLGLSFRGWYLALVECIALYIDAQLVDGVATQDNPWHHDIKKYFQGYLNRTGWAVESKLLDQLLFLPGKIEGVMSYGGGTTHPRIIVSTKILHVAIGDPEEVAPESTFMGWSDGIMGLSSPHNQYNLPPTRSPLTARAISVLSKISGFLYKPASSRSLKSRSSSQRRWAHRKTLGQAATSLGYTLPFPPEELVPLIADSTEDFEIVRQLLAEHYAWFEPDPADEYDDTDPTDRDFFFGALVREIGRIERGDSQLFTLFKGFELRIQKSLPWMRKLHQAVSDLYKRFLSRSSVVLADGYTTLNFAHHHLVQYLYYMAWGEGELLSERADGLKLNRISKKIFRQLGDTEPDKLDRQHRRATIRNRLIWLSQFSYSRLIEIKKTRVKILLIVLVSLVGTVGFGSLIKKAVDYHPVYVQRMTEQQKKMDQLKRESAHKKKGYAKNDKKE